MKGATKSSVDSDTPTLKWEKLKQADCPKCGDGLKLRLGNVGESRDFYACTSCSFKISKDKAIRLAMKYVSTSLLA